MAGNAEIQKPGPLTLTSDHSMAILVPEFPAEAFVTIASQFNFSLCPILLPSFPHTGDS